LTNPFAHGASIPRQELKCFRDILGWHKAFLVCCHDQIGPETEQPSAELGWSYNNRRRVFGVNCAFELSAFDQMR
jgi:hypothetical protein